MRKQKLAKIDSYWLLFAEFCFAENKSRTYSELIERVQHFNSHQTILKKIPESANATNACMLLHTRRSFFRTPTQMPNTIYAYKRQLVRNLYYFSAWLQDNFRYWYGESAITGIMRILEPLLPKRFSELNPDASEIEKAALCVRESVKFGIDETMPQFVAVDTWRREHGSDFFHLQAMLNVEKEPIFANEYMNLSTRHAFMIASRTSTSEHFFWDGKDIAKYLSELSEQSQTGLFFKERLLEGTSEECEVHRVSREGHCEEFREGNSVRTYAPTKTEELDVSKNHYIEGDNLRALKLLSPTYKGRVKMIYIDPPYNTGSTGFVYRDKFKEKTEIFDRLLLAPFPKVKEKK